MAFISADLKKYAETIYKDFWLACPAESQMTDSARVLVELCEELCEFADEPSLGEAGDVLFFVALADKMFMLNLEPCNCVTLASASSDESFAIWAVQDICGGLKRLARPGDDLAAASAKVHDGVTLALRVVQTYCREEGIDLFAVAEANVAKLRARKQAKTLAGIGSDR